MSKRLWGIYGVKLGKGEIRNILWTIYFSKRFPIITADGYKQYGNRLEITIFNEFGA